MLVHSSRLACPKERYFLCRRASNGMKKTNMSEFRPIGRNSDIFGGVDKLALEEVDDE